MSPLIHRTGRRHYRVSTTYVYRREEAQLNSFLPSVLIYSTRTPLLLFRHWMVAVDGAVCDWNKMYCNRKFHSNYHNHVPPWNFFCCCWLLAFLKQNREMAKLYFPSRGICTIWSVPRWRRRSLLLNVLSLFLVCAKDFINCSFSDSHPLVSSLRLLWWITSRGTSIIKMRWMDKAIGKRKKFCPTKQIIE